jgi:hypothetical protein
LKIEDFFEDCQDQEVEESLFKGELTKPVFEGNPEDDCSNDQEASSLS